MMKNVRATAISTNLVIIATTIFTLLSEESAAFKTFLTNMTGHHWVSKGVLALAIFLVSNLILSKTIKTQKDVNKEVKWVIIFAILGFLAMFGFFLFEFFTG